MGCRNSSLEKKISLEESSNKGTLDAQSEPEVKEERPPLTDRQKQLLRDSWKIVQADIYKVGVVMFLKLFEKYPDVQDIFIPYRGQTLDELGNCDRLREHGLQVMRTVEKVIARLDKPENMEALLFILGQKHVMFNTKVDYMDLIGPQFILAIKPTFKNDWTIELEEAWSDFFKLVTFIMKEAMVF